MRLRVALADDQALVREGLKALLKRLGIDVLIEAEDGASLLARLAAPGASSPEGPAAPDGAAQPEAHAAPKGPATPKGPAAPAVDVIVCDIRMPGLDGIGMVRELRRGGNTTPVVLLTTFEDSELMLAAVEAGAQAFLLKGASSEDLRDAIEKAHRGEQWLAPVALEPLRERLAFRDARPPSGTFGEREVEILRLLAGGYSNKEIARSVHLAEGTVKNYVSEILAKLGTRDRTRAVLKAITLRIV